MADIYHATPQRTYFVIVPEKMQRKDKYKKYNKYKIYI